MRTSGLGGDSEVLFDRQMRLRVGPRKAMPLEPAGAHIPADARGTALRSRSSRTAGLRDAIRVPQSRSGRAGASVGARAAGVGGAELASRARYRPWCAMAPGSRRCAGSPMRASRPSPASRRAMRCTCSGGRRDGSREAAECGARILAIEERNGAGRARRPSAAEICERTHEHVVRETGRVLLAAALAQRSRHRGEARRLGRARRRLIEAVVAGRRVLEPARSDARAGAAAGRDRRSGRRLLSGSRAPPRRAAVHSRARGGLQRGGRGRGRGVADRRNSRQSAELQDIPRTRSGRQPRSTRSSDARARACALRVSRELALEAARARAAPGRQLARRWCVDASGLGGHGALPRMLGRTARHACIALTASARSVGISHGAYRGRSRRATVATTRRARPYSL